MNVIAVSNRLYDRTSLYEKKDVVFINDKESLTRENLARYNPEYVFFPHWSYIIPADVYENFQCVVFHMTDLPFGRGGSPLQNLISRGIYETKISAIRCEQGLDTGAIYLKRPFDLSKGSAAELYLQAGEIVSCMIDEIIVNKPQPVPQSGEAVVFKRRTPEMSSLVGINGTRKIYDHIRMLDAEGYPHAYVVLDGVRYEFTNAKIEDGRVLASVTIGGENE